MNLTIVILQIASPIITLLLTIHNIFKTREVNKLKDQTIAAEENVKRIEEAIFDAKNKLANNNKIARVSEMKEKAANFQNMIFKYLKDPKEFEILGYSLESDGQDVNSYVAYLKENSWIFEGEPENYANDLYNDLLPLSNTFNNGDSNEEIHRQFINVKSRHDSFKSKISKIHSESMLL